MEGMPMNDPSEHAVPETGWWARAVMIILRLALLAFLAWALLWGGLQVETPVAEDTGSPTQTGRTAADPCTEIPELRG
jgi:hypothetical protein